MLKNLKVLIFLSDLLKILPLHQYPIRCHTGLICARFLLHVQCRNFKQHNFFYNIHPFNLWKLFPVPTPSWNHISVFQSLICFWSIYTKSTELSETISNVRSFLECFSSAKPSGSFLALLSPSIPPFSFFPHINQVAHLLFASTAPCIL